MAFDLVDDSLQEDLHSLNTETLKHVETTQYRSRIAIQKIEVGNVDNNVVAGLGMDLDTDPLQQASVIAEHIALNPQGRYSAGIVIDLIDLCWHLLKD